MPTIAVDNFTSSAFVGPEIAEIPYSATPSTTLFNGAEYDCFNVATLTGGIAIPAMTNPVKGRMYHFFFKQDATGNRDITWDAQYVFPEGAWVSTGDSANYYSSGSFVYDGHSMRAISVNTWTA